MNKQYNRRSLHTGHCKSDGINTLQLNLISFGVFDAQFSVF